MLLMDGNATRERFCAKCGADADSSHIFCKECGATLAEVVPLIGPRLESPRIGRLQKKNRNISGTALRRTGYGLMLVVSLVSGILMFGLVDDLNHQAGNLGTWIKIALLFGLGTWVWQKGRNLHTMGVKHSSPSAEDLVTKDRRPPVVYLRSFADDVVASRKELQVESSGGGAPVQNPFPPTEEQVLARTMRKIGPFIAIGDPTEELPELGAARSYASSAEWKDKVLAWMLQAKLVVLRAGTTEGFWWEAETVAKTLKPERIIFLLPLTATQYRGFRRRAETFLPCHLPDYPRKKRSIGSIRGILFFESDWTAHFLELRKTGAGWEGALKMTLEPVFKQLGVAWKTPWEVHAYTVKAALTLLVFTFLIVALLYAVFTRSLVWH